MEKRVLSIKFGLRNSFATKRYCVRNLFATKKGTLDKNSDYSHGFGDICTYFNNLEYVSHKNVYLIKHETTKCVKPFR